MKEQGQVAIMLLLVMVVSLAIGLSVAGRSVNEITTSANTENSSRAFSAAEAGIEEMLYQNPDLGTANSSPNISFSNNSKATDVSWNANLPEPQKALEHPAFGKDSFEQFWLIHPTLDCTGVDCYTAGTFQIYFGDKTQDYSAATGIPENQPAIEVHIILKSTNGSIYDKRYFYDSYNGAPSGRNDNKFEGCATLNPAGILTNDYTELRQFYCMVQVPSTGSYKNDPNDTPMMIRVRLLYTNSTHPLAVKPVSGSLPLQASIYRSTGIAGNVQRKLQVFRNKAVMPQFFDFALFSAGELSK